MPTYNYECKSCAHTFEAFQSMKDEPLRECPECGKEIRRIVTGGSGIIFKGSGFYVTDAQKAGGAPNKNSAPKKDGASKDNTSKNAEAKPESPKPPQSSAAKT